MVEEQSHIPHCGFLLQNIHIYLQIIETLQNILENPWKLLF